MHPVSDETVGQSTRDLMSNLGLKVEDPFTSITRGIEQAKEVICRLFTKIRDDLIDRLETELRKYSIWKAKRELEGFEERYGQSQKWEDLMGYLGKVDQVMASELASQESDLRTEVQGINQLCGEWGAWIQTTADDICGVVQKKFEENKQSNQKSSEVLQSECEGRKPTVDIEKSYHYTKEKKPPLEKRPTEAEEETMSRMFDMLSAVNHSESFSRVHKEVDNLVELRQTPTGSQTISPEIEYNSLGNPTTDFRFTKKLLDQNLLSNIKSPEEGPSNLNKSKRTQSDAQEMISTFKDLNQLFSNQISERNILVGEK